MQPTLTTLHYITLPSVHHAFHVDLCLKQNNVINSCFNPAETTLG